MAVEVKYICDICGTKATGSCNNIPTDWSKFAFRYWNYRWSSEHLGIGCRECTDKYPKPRTVWQKLLSLYSDKESTK